MQIEPLRYLGGYEFYNNSVRQRDGVNEHFIIFVVRVLDEWRLEARRVGDGLRSWLEFGLESAERIRIMMGK